MNYFANASEKHKYKQKHGYPLPTVVVGDKKLSTKSCKTDSRTHFV